MSQAFLNGMRSQRGGMGMGDVRQDYQRQDDQNQTVSGNPGLANNMRAVRPMMGAMNVPPVRARLQRPMPPQPGMPAGPVQQMPVQGGGMNGPQFVRPQWAQAQPGMAPQQAQMQAMLPPSGGYSQQTPVRGYQQPMFTNQNMGRFGTNRILNQ